MRTLEELCDFINISNGYPYFEVCQTIEKNNWIDLQHDKFDICSDGKRKITYNKQKFVVL